MARSSRSLAEWDSLIDRYLASGLTQRAFCEREALSFDAFRNRYQKSEKFAGRRRRSAPRTGFVDVTPRRTRAVAAGVQTQSAALTVRLGSRVAIDCPAGTSILCIATLARALAADE